MFSVDLVLSKLIARHEMLEVSEIFMIALCMTMNLEEQVYLKRILLAVGA